MYSAKELIEEIEFSKELSKKGKLYQETFYKEYKDCRNENFLTELLTEDIVCKATGLLAIILVVPVFIAGIQTLKDIVKSKRGAKRDVEGKINEWKQLENNFAKVEELKSEINKIKDSGKVDVKELHALSEKLMVVSSNIVNKLRCAIRDIKGNAECYEKELEALEDKEADLTEEVLEKVEILDDEEEVNLEDEEVKPVMEIAVYNNLPAVFADVLDTEKLTLEQELSKEKAEFIEISNALQNWDVVETGINLKELNLDIIDGIKKACKLSDRIEEHQSRLSMIPATKDILNRF